MKAIVLFLVLVLLGGVVLAEQLSDELVSVINQYLSRDELIDISALSILFGQSAAGLDSGMLERFFSGLVIRPPQDKECLGFFDKEIAGGVVPVPAFRGQELTAIYQSGELIELAFVVVDTVSGNQVTSEMTYVAVVRADKTLFKLVAYFFNIEYDQSQRGGAYILSFPARFAPGFYEVFVWSQRTVPVKFLIEIE